jgi:hypothetical protein
VEFKPPKFVFTHDVVGILEELSVLNKGAEFISG